MDIFYNSVNLHTIRFKELLRALIATYLVTHYLDSYFTVKR